MGCVVQKMNLKMIVTGRWGGKKDKKKMRGKRRRIEEDD